MQNYSRSSALEQCKNSLKIIGDNKILVNQKYFIEYWFSFINYSLEFERNKKLEKIKELELDTKGCFIIDQKWILSKI